jgi:hypothetical protein
VRRPALAVEEHGAAQAERHGSRLTTILSRSASAILYSFAAASIAAFSSGAWHCRSRAPLPRRRVQNARPSLRATGSPK